MSAKQHILPFFLPMAGCPHACVYCDQRAISGEQSAPPPSQVAARLAQLPVGSALELAYYGGSFTCLPQSTQAAYLAAAAPALADGRLSGIRLSTRPDAVDADSCAWLRAQGVTTVELGVQSFSDAVLTAAGRCCTAEQAAQGCAAVRDAGLTLGVQLMTGLPADTDAQARDSMRRALSLGAQLLRIYPTLVLGHTPLAALWQQGDYAPHSVAHSVALCADLLTLATAAGVPVIRIGINPGPDVEAALLAGPYHPAFGGLVKEELRSRQLACLLTGADAAQPAQLRFARRDLPLLFGQQRQRVLALARDWPQLALVPTDSLPPGRLTLEQQGTARTLDEDAYCRAIAAQM